MYKAEIRYQDGTVEIQYFEAERWITKEEPDTITLGDISNIKINRHTIEYIFVQKVKEGIFKICK